MTLEELIARCKGEVSLTVNEHRTYYQTPSDWLADCFKNQWSECGPILASNLWGEKCETYNLHFYPDTPIGSYHIVGNSLETVLEKAAECLATRGRDDE